MYSMREPPIPESAGMADNVNREKRILLDWVILALTALFIAVSCCDCVQITTQIHPQIAVEKPPEPVISMENNMTVLLLAMALLQMLVTILNGGMLNGLRCVVSAALVGVSGWEYLGRVVQTTLRSAGGLSSVTCEYTVPGKISLVLPGILLALHIAVLIYRKSVTK